VNDEEEKDETARPAMKEEVRPQREEEEEDPELEVESRTRDVELDEAPSDKAPMEVQSAIAISHSNSNSNSNSNKRGCVLRTKERERQSQREEKDKVLPVRSKEPPVKTVGSVGPKGNPGRVLLGEFSHCGGRKRKGKKKKEKTQCELYKGIFWIKIKCKSRHILRKESHVAIFRQ
jgi:hypothetical protein